MCKYVGGSKNFRCFRFLAINSIIFLPDLEYDLSKDMFYILFIMEILKQDFQIGIDKNVIHVYIERTFHIALRVTEYLYECIYNNLN